MKHYERLSLKEREEISRSLAAGISCQKISKKLGRYCSSITREIKRNNNKENYRAVDAQEKAHANAEKPRNKRKLKTNKKLERIVVKYLRKHKQ